MSGPPSSPRSAASITPHEEAGGGGRGIAPPPQSPPGAARGTIIEAARMGLPPFIGRPHDIVQLAETGEPARLATDQLRRCDQHSRVPGAPRRHAIWYLS